MQIGPVIRDWRTAAFSYTLLRLAGIVGASPARFEDSTGYLRLEFMKPSARTWPVPLVYSLAGDDRSRVIVQALIGCAAWSAFAIVAARRTRFPASVRAVILLVGLAPQVTRFDAAILSESISISLVVAVVTAALWTVEKPGRSRIPLLVTWALAVAARPEHLVLAIVVSAAVAGAAFARRRLPSAAMTVVILVGVGAWQQVRHLAPIRDINVYTVIDTRVKKDDTAWDWWTSRGMPDIERVRYSSGYDNQLAVPADVRTYLRIPPEQSVPTIVRTGGMELARWVHEDGWRTLAKWVAEHPSATGDHLAAVATPALSPRTHTFLPTPHRRIFPDWLFGQWQLWAAACGTGLIALLLSARRTDMLVAASIAGAVAFLVPLVLLGSGIEHQRHAAVAAVMLRVCALTCICLAGGRPPAGDGDGNGAEISAAKRSVARRGA